MQVIISKENEKDLADMPKKITDDSKITPVEHADEVLKIALTKELSGLRLRKLQNLMINLKQASSNYYLFFNKKNINKIYTFFCVINF